ncbi:MAG: hypothetical protein WCO54_00780 [Bacteroidota bacterium]
MDIFTQKKLLSRAVVILIVLNMCVIGFVIWKTTNGKHEPSLFPKAEFRDVSGILKTELDLNEKQVEQIKQLRTDFFEKEKILTKQIRNERDSMNQEMFNKHTNDELVKLLAKNIADNEYKMEMLRYDQALQLKKICKPEQLEKFETLVLQIRDYFRPDNQPPPK